MKPRLISWLLVGVVGVSTLLFAAIDEGEPATNADRAYALSQDFACPECQGQSVAESDVPVARNIRREIRVWVDEGRTDEFIRDQLVAAFGEDIDYTPSSEGVTALVWILPVVVGAVAVGGLVVVFRRWRLDDEVAATDADAALVEAARAERP
ncbi:MAG: cytochrome c-type biogenesis protein CcmH [Actinomycetota bacterium]